MGRYVDGWWMGVWMNGRVDVWMEGLVKGWVSGMMN